MLYIIYCKGEINLILRKYLNMILVCTILAQTIVSTSCTASKEKTASKEETTEFFTENTSQESILEKGEDEDSKLVFDITTDTFITNYNVCVESMEYGELAVSEDNITYDKKTNKAYLKIDENSSIELDYSSEGDNKLKKLKISIKNASEKDKKGLYLLLGVIITVGSSDEQLENLDANECVEFAQSLLEDIYDIGESSDILGSTKYNVLYDKEKQTFDIDILKAK